MLINHSLHSIVIFLIDNLQWWSFITLTKLVNLTKFFLLIQLKSVLFNINLFENLQFLISAFLFLSYTSSFKIIFKSSQYLVEPVCWVIDKERKQTALNFRFEDSMNKVKIYPIAIILHKAPYICFLSFFICMDLIKSLLLVIRFSNKFAETLFN